MLLRKKNPNPKNEELKLKPVIAKEYCDFNGWFTDAGGTFLVRMDEKEELHLQEGKVKLYDEIEIGIHSIDKEFFEKDFSFITEEEYKQFLSVQEEGIGIEELKETWKKYNVNF